MRDSINTGSGHLENEYNEDLERQLIRELRKLDSLAERGDEQAEARAAIIHDRIARLHEADVERVVGLFSPKDEQDARTAAWAIILSAIGKYDPEAGQSVKRMRPINLSSVKQWIDNNPKVLARHDTELHKTNVPDAVWRRYSVEDSQFDELLVSQAYQALHVIFSKLSVREQEIIRLRLHKLSFEKIGDKLSVTGSRIRQIEYGAMRKLAESLKDVREFREFADDEIQMTAKYGNIELFGVEVIREIVYALMGMRLEKD